MNGDLKAPLAGPAGTSEGTSDGPGAGTRRPRLGGRHTGAFQRVRTGGPALKKKVESVLPSVEPSARGGSPKSLFQIRASMDPGSEHTFAT